MDQILIRLEVHCVHLTVKKSIIIIVDSLVFFIPVIAIKVKSVSEEIQSVWRVTLGKIKEACVEISLGLYVLRSIR